MAQQKLSKDRRHDHFWIEDEVLFESYQTIRGLRYRNILEVSGMKDCDRCTPEIIQEIEHKFLTNT